MSRKIIQIATTTGTEGGCDFVYALCDDGTLWYLYNQTGATWRDLPDVPQPEDDIV